MGGGSEGFLLRFEPFLVFIELIRSSKPKNGMLPYTSSWNMSNSTNTDHAYEIFDQKHGAYVDLVLFHEIRPSICLNLELGVTLELFEKKIAIFSRISKLHKI